MAIQHVFNSHQRQMQVVMPDGKGLVFNGWKYFTSKQYEIDFLNKFILDNGNTADIYVDPEEVTIDDSVSTQDMIRAKYYAEFLKEQAAKNTVAGDTELAKLNVQNSIDVAAVAGGTVPKNSGVIPNQLGNSNSPAEVLETKLKVPTAPAAAK